MAEKIKLSFVNGGKPFDIPHMTVSRQEELMEKIVEVEKKYSDEKKRNQEINKYMVLKTLQLVNKDVNIEHINNMHPDDFVFVFQMVWDKGREIHSEKNFQ